MDKLARIRADAMKKGYVIDYPGIYCDKAEIRPLAPSDTKPIVIDMRDRVRGLNTLDCTVAIIADLSRDK